MFSAYSLYDLFIFTVCISPFAVILGYTVEKSVIDVVYYIAMIFGVFGIFHSEGEDRQITKMKLQADWVDWQIRIERNNSDTKNLDFPITARHEGRKIQELEETARYYCFEGSEISCRAAKFIDKNSRYSPEHFTYIIDDSPADICRDMEEFKAKFYSYIEAEMTCSGFPGSISDGFSCSGDYLTEEQEISIKPSGRQEYNLYQIIREAVITEQISRDLFDEYIETEFTCGGERQDQSVSDLIDEFDEIEIKIFEIGSNDGKTKYELYIFNNYWAFVLVAGISLKLWSSLWIVVRKLRESEGRSSL